MVLLIGWRLPFRGNDTGGRQSSGLAAFSAGREAGDRAYLKNGFLVPVEDRLA